MSNLDSEIDANFYQLIHQLAGSPRHPDQSERRGKRRQAFLVVQRIAPLGGGGFPGDSEFFQVRCHDLSEGGFSFFLPRPPEFTSLVAAFGSPPEMIYVGADVSHSANVLVHRSGWVEQVEGRAGHVSYQGIDGDPATPMVLVGCRFTRRLQKPAADDAPH